MPTKVIVGKFSPTGERCELVLGEVCLYSHVTLTNHLNSNLLTFKMKELVINSRCGPFQL